MYSLMHKELERTADLVSQYFVVVYNERLTTEEKRYETKVQQELLLQIRTKKEKLETALSSYPKLLKDLEEEATYEAMKDYAQHRYVQAQSALGNKVDREFDV